MATISRSARLYLERKGLEPTHRRPMSVVASQNLLVRDYPVTAPLPWPHYLGETQGDPVPDRGTTTEWPPTS